MTNLGRAKYYKWEKLLKGAANHRRLEMLELLNNRKELSTEDMVEMIKINYNTGASHARYLVRSGLVDARREGSSIMHSLLPAGKAILVFVKKLK